LQLVPISGESLEKRENILAHDSLAAVMNDAVVCRLYCATRCRCREKM